MRSKLSVFAGIRFSCEIQQRYSHKAFSLHEMTKSKHACFLKCLMMIVNEYGNADYADYADFLRAFLNWNGAD